MPEPANNAGDPAEPRRRAEARLAEKRFKRSSPPGNHEAAADPRRLLHELEVHQVELELQNEELAQARDKLEILLEKYTDLYDFAPVGYLTLDQAGNIREANLAASHLLKLPRSALVTLCFKQFVLAASLPGFEIFLEQLFAGPLRRGCEVTLNVAGQPPLMIALEGLVFESGQACRLTLTDITELKRAEADRLILNKLESTGVLAGGIAHDFNNLLTVILLNLELAEMLVPPDPELAQFLAEAKRSSLLSRHLTAQLLTFAEGGSPIRREILLARLITESVELALSGSKVRGEFFLANDLWPAEVDEAQMGQVIRAIVLNAREAMPQGGVVSVTAENVVLSASEHASLAPGNYVRIRIADQGTGIPEAILPKIFDPYFSTKQRGNRQGMGLGLTICHSIVQKHQGAISVESEVAVGTSFIIYLPAARKLSVEENSPPPAGAAPPGRVLVMDDEETVREVVGRTLAGMGHTVELAPDGQTAIEAYKNALVEGRCFDAVVLDLTIREGMGGLDSLQELLKLDPRVQAIAMSGSALDPVMQEPGRYGFRGALTKPFDSETLQEYLVRVMTVRAASWRRP